MRISGDSADELQLLEKLAKGFESSGYSFPSLVKEIVTLPQYRRVR
jgi:hypothetical protein